MRPETWVDQLGNRYEETMQDPVTGEFYTRESYEATVAENPSKVIILYKMPPEEIPSWIRLPGVVMGSDAMPVPADGWDSPPWDTPFEAIPNVHPRTAGSHGKSLRLARENEIPLMHVLATFSYYPARYLGDTGLEAMKIRGRLQEGMVADIVVVDPESVTDNSTYERGTLPTTGIPNVIVNGVVVVRDSTVLPDTFPGQPIRFPVESKPRFQPLELDDWEERFLVSPVGFHGLD